MTPMAVCEINRPNSSISSESDSGTLGNEIPVSHRLRLPALDALVKEVSGTSTSSTGLREA